MIVFSKASAFENLRATRASDSILQAIATTTVMFKAEWETLTVPLIKGPIHIAEIVLLHLVGLTIIGRTVAITIDIVATSSAIVEIMTLNADLGLSTKAVSIHTTTRDIRMMKYLDHLDAIVASLIVASNRNHLIHSFLPENDPIIVVTAWTASQANIEITNIRGTYTGIE
jgi:hypothetical protein